MSIIHVIRHGQASFGHDDYDQLSELGLRQSSLTGLYLRQSGIIPDAVYLGALRRQRQTAEAALEGLSASQSCVLPGLDEYDSGAILKALLPAMCLEEPGLEASL